MVIQDQEALMTEELQKLTQTKDAEIAKLKAQVRYLRLPSYQDEGLRKS